MLTNIKNVIVQNANKKEAENTEVTMKELLFSVGKKDLDIEFFSGTGAGGQYRNKHQNCVRIKHRESGAMSTGQSNRERPANIKEAFNNLIKNPLFVVWHSKKVQEMLSGKSLEEKVKESMKPQNLKVEGKEDGKWKELSNPVETLCD